MISSGARSHVDILTSFSSYSCSSLKFYGVCVQMTLCKNQIDKRVDIIILQPQSFTHINGGKHTTIQLSTIIFSNPLHIHTHSIEKVKDSYIAAK